MSMKTYGVSQQLQQTRHARRIYIGGLPPNYITEDDLRNFLNKVIAQGLGEENDNSYVLSVYINQKKCFAFVELKSIELTTACLELDGLIFRKIVLKVLRANEYKPDLVPQAFANKILTLDLSSFSFGNPSNSFAQHNLDSNEFSELRLDSFIQLSNLGAVEKDSLVIVGFPYDDGNSNKTRSAIASNSNIFRGLGATLAPKTFRNSIRKYKYGVIQNPEFEVDLSYLKLFDVGDVLTGKSIEDTKSNLSATVTEIISRDAIPFLIGGSNDQLLHSIGGVLTLTGPSLGVINISPSIDLRLLDDARFCPLVQRTNSTGSSSLFPSCDRRYIQFAAQGSQCTSESVQYLTQRDGQIVWLSRDLHNSFNNTNPAQIFKIAMKSLQSVVPNSKPSGQQQQNPNAETVTTSVPLPIVVSLDVGALASNCCPNSSSNSSPIGLTLDEVLDIAMICGANSNVVLFEVTEFSPDAEDTRSNILLAEIFYKFCVGFATRQESTSNKSKLIPSKPPIDTFATDTRTMQGPGILNSYSNQPKPDGPPHPSYHRSQSPLTAYSNSFSGSPRASVGNVSSNSSVESSNNTSLANGLNNPFNPTAGVANDLNSNLYHSDLGSHPQSILTNPYGGASSLYGSSISSNAYQINNNSKTIGRFGVNFQPLRSGSMGEADSSVRDQNDDFFRSKVATFSRSAAGNDIQDLTNHSNPSNDIRTNLKPFQPFLESNNSEPFSHQTSMGKDYLTSDCNITGRGGVPSTGYYPMVPPQINIPTNSYQQFSHSFNHITFLPQHSSDSTGGYTTSSANSGGLLSSLSLDNTHPPPLSNASLLNIKRTQSVGTPIHHRKSSLNPSNNRSYSSYHDPTNYSKLLGNDNFFPNFGLIDTSYTVPDPSNNNLRLDTFHSSSNEDVSTSIRPDPLSNKSSSLSNLSEPSHSNFSYQSSTAQPKQHSGLDSMFQFDPNPTQSMDNDEPLQSASSFTSPSSDALAMSGPPSLISEQHPSGGNPLHSPTLTGMSISATRVMSIKANDLMQMNRSRSDSSNVVGSGSINEDGVSYDHDMKSQISSGDAIHLANQHCGGKDS